MTGICSKQEPVGEKSYSPLGCSCQGSREAGIIHLIGSYCYIYKTKQPSLRGIFLLYWAKGREKFPLLSQQTESFLLSVLCSSHISISSLWPFFLWFSDTQDYLLSQPCSVEKSCFEIMVLDIKWKTVFFVCISASHPCTTETDPTWNGKVPVLTYLLIFWFTLRI